VTETVHLVNTGRALQELPPVAPKGGARFHFELPGSVQGFRAEAGIQLENVRGQSQLGERSLAVRVGALTKDLKPLAATATFIPQEAMG